MIKRSKRIYTAEKIESKFNIIRTVLSIFIALVLAFLLILIVSEKPIDDFSTLLFGPMRNSRSIITVLSKMVPLLFTAVAISLVYQTGQMNIGAEGAFFAGSVAATAVAIIPGIPKGIHILLSMLAGGLAGAIVMGIPGILYTKFKSVTIVTSLMMNYVALNIGLYFILNPLRDPAAGFEGSYAFMDSAILSKLFNTRLSSGIIIAVIVVLFAIFILNKTTFGYKMKAIGNNPKFANYSGINVNKTIILVSLLAGCLAGIGGSVEILGNYNRFMYSEFTNHGWDGMMISVLCRNNPKLIPVGTFFLAYLQTSADTLNLTSNIPPELISIVQAIIIIFIAAKQFLKSWEHRSIIENSKINVTEEEE